MDNVKELLTTNHRLLVKRGLRNYGSGAAFACIKRLTGHNPCGAARPSDRQELKRRRSPQR